jgi:anthraniloyl-CoA monooxygenase
VQSQLESRTSQSEDAAVKIACIGGGPAGLYFALLSKKRDPASEVTVFERNAFRDTFGFGVVFSDATLDNLASIDAESHRAITSRFFHWDDIAIHVPVGEEVRRFVSRGHGFSGIARTALLEILEERAISLGVEVRHEAGLDAVAFDARKFDLVLIADGVNSAFRDANALHFKPSIDMRPNRFVWLGTTFPFDAFTFYFKRAAAGLFQVHAYRYAEGQSTFIVECTEDVFRRTGLHEADEDGTIAYLSEIFKAELDGHPLLKNRSIWRQFPIVRNGRWHHENLVLAGDAVHTAHFSIGSGTKLAIEDAIALRDAVDASDSVSHALTTYEKQRRPVAESYQRAAQVSLEWFENTERTIRHEPLTFAFSLLTRSLRVTHENLKKRDPEFVRGVDEAFEREASAQSGESIIASATPRPPMFTPFRLRDVVLPNRVGVSSMCMYAARDGTIDDFHLVHLGSRAIGGAGLIMTEMTDVSADGRITPGCAGMYATKHVDAWRRVVEFVHRHSPAKIGMQIGHAGRKGSTHEPWVGPDVFLGESENPWPLIAPSSKPWTEGSPIPKSMDAADLERVKADFVRSTELANEAGFDLIELHAAHGYLLATFLSPLTNQRTDAYGGSAENRARFPVEVFEAMRAVWPTHKPMSVRLSASDWASGGTTMEDLLAAAYAFKRAGCDIIDVSSGSTVPEQRPAYGRLYQVPFSEVVRSEVEIPTMCVGNISSYADVNSVLAAKRADVCLIARAHLYDPYWVRHAAREQGFEIPWPKSYGVMQFYTPRT